MVVKVRAAGSAGTGKVGLAMKRVLRSFVVLVLLVGCTLAPPPVVRTAAPADFPAKCRWDLVPQWIRWSSPNAAISWPPDDGCATAPDATTLPAGALIDRFGDETGTFFSPRGESFASRAVPYVCEQMDYRVYRVLQPLPVKACKAAPWFNEPGGAVQEQTAEPAAKLVAERRIAMVDHVAGGSSGPFPQCVSP
jgi:hypothetical protein